MKPPTREQTEQPVSATHSKRETIESPPPERTPHSGSMLERWGLLGRFLSRLFFAPVFFPLEFVDVIRRAASQGTVVYVLRMRNTLEFLYFNYAFLAHGLPLARFANGVRFWLWQPLRLLLRQLFGKNVVRREGTEVLRRLTQARRSSALFLRAPPGLIPPADFEGPYLHTLIELQQRQERAIMLMPLTVIWGRQPVRPPKGPLGLFDPMLGDQDEPRLFRRVWQVLRHARRSLAVACEPLDLKQFLAGLKPGEDPVQALEGKLVGRIENERRMRIGPRRAHPIELRRRIADSPRITEAIRTRASSTGHSTARVRRHAFRELKRMQAAMTSRGLLRVAWMLRKIWRRMFSGFEVDEAGMTRVQKWCKEGPLIFLPTHRSHADYLIMSHLCLARDLLPPHIAAGANLAFWPLGWLFRTAGAFFIRRRSQGDDLYAALLREYVAALLKEGHNLEIFIEGTRSRSGRVLPPKLGLLSVVADLVADGEVPPVYVVPASIGYERVPEVNSLTRELSGGKKETETMGGVLRATKVLKSKFGYINVQFAEPIDAQAFLAQRGLTGRETPLEVRRQAIASLGFHNNSASSAVTAITPTLLCSAALLAPGTQGVERSTLEQALAVLGEAARIAGARFVDGMYTGDRPLDEAGIDHAIDLLSSDKAVAIMGKGETGTVYVVESQARIILEYYKNQMVQHVLITSLMAMVLRALYLHEGESIAYDSLHRACRFIASLVRLHFVHHAGETLDELIGLALQRLIALGLVRKEPDNSVRLVSEGQEDLTLLASQIESTIEAHGATAKALLVLRGGPRPRDTLERDLLEQLHRWYLIDKLGRYESCQLPLVTIAIDWLCDEGILMLRGEGKSTQVALTKKHTDGKALEVLVQRTERLLPKHVPW